MPTAIAATYSFEVFNDDYVQMPLDTVARVRASRCNGCWRRCRGAACRFAALRRRRSERVSPCRRRVVRLSPRFSIIALDLDVRPA